MAIDIKRLRNSGFEARTADVLCRDLAPLFGDGEEPLVKVRGLTGPELGESIESVSLARNLGQAIEALAGGNNAERVNALRMAMGVQTDVPTDIARRLVVLRYGVVDPALTHEDSVKICSAFPEAFYSLTKRILELTGEGHELGKRQRSSAVAKSEEH